MGRVQRLQGRLVERDLVPDDEAEAEAGGTAEPGTGRDVNERGPQSSGDVPELIEDRGAVDHVDVATGRGLYAVADPDVEVRHGGVEVDRAREPTARPLVAPARRNVAAGLDDVRRRRRVLELVRCRMGSTGHLVV